VTVEVMADWARRDKGNSDKPATWARRLAADSSEGGHLFQPDRGHHSNLMAASLLSSRGPVSVMS
jgi:hypothetical protein